MDLSKLLSQMNGGGKGAEKQNEEKKDKSISELRQELHDVADKKIKNINKQIVDANDDSEKYTEIYNDTIDNIKKAENKYKIGVLGKAKKSLENNNNQQQLMDKQVLLQSKQKVVQENSQSGQFILQDLQEKAQNMAKYEESLNNNIFATEDQSSGQVTNPLVSSEELRALLKVMQRFYRKKQERDKKRLEKEQGRLKEAKSENDALMKKINKNENKQKKAGDKIIRKEKIKQRNAKSNKDDANSKIEQLESKNLLINKVFNKYRKELIEDGNDQAVEDFNKELEKKTEKVDSGEKIEDLLKEYDNDNVNKEKYDKENDFDEQKNSNENHDNGDNNHDVKKDSPNINKLLNKKEEENGKDILNKNDNDNKTLEENNKQNIINNSINNGQGDGKMNISDINDAKSIVNDNHNIKNLQKSNEMSRN